MMNARLFPFNVHQIVTILSGNVTGPDSCNVPGPGHTLSDHSLSIKIDPTAPDGFICHSFADDDDLVCKDYVKQRLGLPKWEPKNKNGSHLAGFDFNRATRRGDYASGPSRVTDEYIYRQADGSPYLKVCRTSDKCFFQQHWNGRGWSKGAPDGPKIPYRLKELLAAEHDDVFIVEGEKDCENLAMHGLTATTNSCGAGKWSSDLNCFFAGKNVYILPDNDEVGVHHARNVALNLLPIAREVRVVDLPGLPPKGDVSDWLAAGGTLEELIDIARFTAPLQPGDPASSHEEAN